MKRHLPLAALLVMALAGVSLAQEATPSPSPKPKAPRVTKAQLQKQLTDLENTLWEAFKNKDAKPFATYLANDSVIVDGAGVSAKSSITGALSSCNLSSYGLSDWKMTKWGANTALLTYKATQSGTCGGSAMPANVWVSSVWVKRKGTWVTVFHQETTAY
jgi:hypothetical protein